MEEKSTRMPVGNNWVFVVAAMLFLYQIATSVLAQSDNSANIKPESNQAAEVKKREDMGRASIFTPRVVGDDELVEKRSEIEDRLRKRLLAVSEAGAFRELLNAPWTEQNVEQFGKFLIPIRDEEHGYPGITPSVNESQWANIMYLLAFVATTYRDQPAGLRAAEAFDRAMVWTANKGRSFDKYWFYCMHAIGMYGSSDLLTPTFWKAQDQRLDCREAFFCLGNEKELMKLKTFNHNQSTQTNDEPIAIGHELKRAKMAIPQHRYKGD